jgi:polyhydroxybutyrate depolymerase
MRTLTVITALALLGLAAAPAPQRRTAPPLGPGDAELTLTHGGRRRSYLAHVPPVRAGATAPRPVLLAFHGGGGNAKGFKDSAGLDAVSDREGFVVVYPNGTGPLRSLLLTFNAGNNCCGSAQRQDVDDVGFAVAVLADLDRRLDVDRERVYATGHSNGAIMSYRLAAGRADLIAAIAPVAGAMSLDAFAPSHPVPVMHIHSVDDPRALYGGGVGPPFPGTNSRVTHAPVQASLDQWIATNGCSQTPKTTATRAGAPGSGNADQTATRLSYGPCKTGADVVHWKLTGVGHGWPGATSGSRERIIGPRTTLVSAADEVWAFVSQYSRPR